MRSVAWRKSSALVVGGGVQHHHVEAARVVYFVHFLHGHVLQGAAMAVESVW